jgi:high-affinity nickel-transport protein
MRGAALLTIVAALGMRHGVDPDHLAAIDGLSRFHPSRWNGVFFAMGHGMLVTVLAVGFGTLLAGIVAPYTARILLALGLANLVRLLRPSPHHHRKIPRIFQASPLLLGVLFGMGFETASQLSALLLAGKLNPWILGCIDI